MRELTQSMIRLSWSLPLLAAGQAVELVTPGGDRRPLDRAAETLDALSETAYRQMSPRWRDLYQRGDRLQRRSLDGLLGTLDRFSGRGDDRCCGERH